MLVAGFLDDREEFSRFYRAHARGLLLFFTRRTFDPEAALDLTAETFAAAFASRASFRGESDAQAGGWLFVIARRQLAGLDAGQREALWLRVVDEQPYARVASRLGISEQAARARVSRALRAIGESLVAIPSSMEGVCGE